MDAAISLLSDTAILESKWKKNLIVSVGPCSPLMETTQNYPSDSSSQLMGEKSTVSIYKILLAQTGELYVLLL